MKGNITEEELIAERKRVGNLLRQKREERGYKQEDFAQLTGMSRSTISKIEAGNWNFGIDTLTLFTKHLGIEKLGK
ncbi:XRE family transcriptional regulator [Adhaeribacter arboris]|uniref:XRE family transcriptional regulator n=1 Tax=Adhaeribacter arboris TaxID=2072846 RepID=A0A2T2YF17_9BACT|nr:helix-turn-helix transcriptional regulator [Adhaeribacter arboris]PSR54111.1 XRE family transcriptional regulator [Adhaeribacter arboris]